jgi:hypothetical protein
MKGCGKLDVIHFQLTCEIEPLFDGNGRSCREPFGRQFLKCCGEDWIFMNRGELSNAHAREINA